MEKFIFEFDLINHESIEVQGKDFLDAYDTLKKVLDGRKDADEYEIKDFSKAIS